MTLQLPTFTGPLVPETAGPYTSGTKVVIDVPLSNPPQDVNVVVGLEDGSTATVKLGGAARNLIDSTSPADKGKAGYVVATVDAGSVVWLAPDKLQVTMP